MLPSSCVFPSMCYLNYFCLDYYHNVQRNAGRLQGVVVKSKLFRSALIGGLGGTKCLQMQLWTNQSLQKNLCTFFWKNVSRGSFGHTRLYRKTAVMFLELELQHDVTYKHVEILTCHNNIIKLIISIVTYCT